MFAPFAARLPRLGMWPRLALVACCLLLALDSAATARTRTRSAAPDAVPVVVAARPLTAGARVGATDVRIARWPRVAVVPEDARRRSDVVGRRVVTGIGRGEAFSALRLLGRDLSAGLAAGEVAVPVQVADDHAPDLLHAGDRVALYATARPADATDPDGTDSDDHPPAAGRSAVVADGLRVLAVLPAADAVGAELVVATSRSTALTLTQANTTKTLSAVAEPP